MASAQLLPSGAWRCRATKIVNGQKIQKSFTVHPKDYGNDATASRKAKIMAEKQAREWFLNEEKKTSKTITVAEAIDRYNESREAVLSPSTIPDYYRMKKYFKKIHDVDIHDITTDMIQGVIGDLSVMTNRYGKRISTRTIKNRVYYLLAVLNYFEIKKKFTLKFPPDEVDDDDSNSDDYMTLIPLEKNEFKRLLDCTKDNEQKLILVLAGLYTLRRSEIAGLTGSDIIWDMHCITIRKSRVYNKDKKWVLKSYLKTDQSRRMIEIDPALMDLFPKVGPKEYVIKKNPNQITKFFSRLRKKAGVTCRLHDLRKFAASIRSDIMSSKYVEVDGGWNKNSTVLQKVYDKAFREERHEYSKKFNKMVREKFGDQLLG